MQFRINMIISNTIKAPLATSVCYRLAQTVTTFFYNNFLIVREQKMSDHENFFDVYIFKMSTSELKNCRQHIFAVSKYFLNVDGKMVSKMKQINVNAD